MKFFLPNKIVGILAFFIAWVFLSPESKLLLVCSLNERLYLGSQEQLSTFLTLCDNHTEISNKRL